MTIFATDVNGFNHAGAVRLSEDALGMALEFAAKIPTDVLADHPERLIVRDDQQAFQLALT